jgi:hypothetical protein
MTGYLIMFGIFAAVTTLAGGVTAFPPADLEERENQ